MIPPVTQNPTPWPAWPRRGGRRCRFRRGGRNLRETARSGAHRRYRRRGIPVHPSIAVPLGAVPEIRGIQNVVPHGFVVGADALPIENSGVFLPKPFAGRTYPPVSESGFTCRFPAPR